MNSDYNINESLVFQSVDIEQAPERHVLNIGDFVQQNDFGKIKNIRDYGTYGVAFMSLPEVVYDWGDSEPTKDDLSTAMSRLPNFSTDWISVDVQFYVWKDNLQEKLILVQYIHKREGLLLSDGDFYYETFKLIT